MKIANGTFAKMFTVGLIAGAALLAAPAKAEAQVRVGVVIAPPIRFGPPVYAAPVPVYGGFYGRPFYGPRYGWERREEFYRHDDRRFHR